MKLRLMLALTCVAAGLAAGCASQNPALTAQPTHEELPTIERPEAATPIIVAVEHGGDKGRTRLVPDFKVPEPTPEEQAALGTESPRHKFLLYNPLPPVGSSVGSWFGGVRTGVAGVRGATVAIDRDRTVSSSTGVGGPITAVDPTAAPAGRASPNEKSIAKTGPDGGIRVGTDPVPKKTGGRDSH